MKKTDNKEKILVSVIVPTLDRSEAIYDLVKNLKGQSYENFEIIVVDQSQGGNRSLDELMIGTRDRIKYFKIALEGTCQAKNFALKKARGEIIIFLDDDIRIEDKNFIKYHVANYLEPKIAGVGGRVKDINLKLNKEQKGPILRVSKTGRIFANSNSERRAEIDAPRGGNVSYRRSYIFEIGGFDEGFIGNAMREETDFSLRIFKAGGKIIFEPKAVVVHLSLPRGGSRKKDRISWYFDFFHNETLFFLKHFSKKYLPIFIIRKLRPILACMFWYGKLRPKALFAPLKGFISGVKTYQKKEDKWL